MDPFCDYYLCTKKGQTELVEAFWSDDEALGGYESVQKLAFWQALQFVLALEELQQSPGQDLALFPLAAFLKASEEVIAEFFKGEPPTEG